MRCLTIVLSIQFFLWQGGYAPAANFSIIEGPPTCSSCAIEFEHDVSLADRADVGFPVVGGSQHVVRASTGRILLTHNYETTHVFEFDSEGRFLRALGSRGNGPGEFIMAGELIVDDDDRLYVFDEVQRRMTVFSPGLEIVDTRNLPVRVRQAIVVPGGFVVAAPSRSPDLIGLPLHTLSYDLQVSRSFGAVDETARPDMQILQSRSIATGEGTKIWAARVSRYAFDEWDSDTGERLRAYERRVDWFTPWVADELLSFDTPPQPRFQDIRQDADGLLWTIAATAARSWAEGLIGIDGGTRVTVRDLERLFDSVIEVIDPASGKLLASRQVDQFLMGFANDGSMIGYREPDDDVPQLDLWRARLSGRRRPS